MTSVRFGVRSGAMLGSVLAGALVVSACGEMMDEEVGETRQASGVTGPAFYVDGELYRTVGTPADLPTDAPADSFDIIYDVSQYQAYNVAGAAPGQPGFNGGRWMVHAISFVDYAAALVAHDANGSGDFDNDEEVEAALQAGAATDLGVVAVFECPVIPLPQGHAASH